MEESNIPNPDDAKEVNSKEYGKIDSQPKYEYNSNYDYSKLDKVMEDFTSKYGLGAKKDIKPPAIVTFEIHNDDIKMEIDINKESTKTYDLLAGYLFLLTTGQMNISIGNILEKKLVESDENYEIYSRIINRIRELKNHYQTEIDGNELVVKPSDILNHRPQQPQYNPFKNLMGGSNDRI